MSVLTKPEIIKAIKKKEIVIEPLNIENIGPASVDLTLWNKFRVFKQSWHTTDATDEVNYKDITRLVVSDSIVLKPNETILGMTVEKITLPPNICGWLEGRSRYARLGLCVHISAPFMQPGISNRQVLEISNMSNRPIRLHAGTKMCQFIFQRTIGRAIYAGVFREQDEP